MKYIFLILIAVLSICINAQKNERIAGVFFCEKGSFGFEDSLYFKKNKLIVKLHPAVGYGTVHIFTYKMKYELNNIIFFKEIRHRTRPSGHKSSGLSGYFDKKHIHIILLENGNLQIGNKSDIIEPAELRFIPTIDKLH